MLEDRISHDQGKCEHKDITKGVHVNAVLREIINRDTTKHNQRYTQVSQPVILLLQTLLFGSEACPEKQSIATYDTQKCDAGIGREERACLWINTPRISVDLVTKIEIGCPKEVVDYRSYEAIPIGKNVEPWKREKAHSEGEVNRWREDNSDVGDFLPKKVARKSSGIEGNTKPNEPKRNREAQ
jgi:hypothetical protein